ncbi:YezD family protein [Methylotenera versatilis]|uniref:YezD family protein n=1 Tax=Methylotenera versatilis TaxID=1055487 RepID=UPI0006481AD5|nr:YezD family protein [Methylotenera versatilis]
MSQIKHKLLDKEDEVLQAILRAVTSVQQQTGYGSIEITVHDGRVTQIERREKVRFEHKVGQSKI